jgi:GDP-D-mannose 3', 5'-epimerase
MVSINQLAGMIADIAGKKIDIDHIPGPQGVRGRNSDNRLINELLGWAPSQPLRNGLERSYEWIERQVMRNAA